MSEDPQFLFLFSIGPVQSFIASARKAQDLWAGSYLLSWLIRKGADCLITQGAQENARVEMIFPIIEKDTCQDLALYPNRFLALLKGGTLNKDKLRTIGNKVAEEIRKEFKEIIIYAKKKFPPDVEDFVARQLQDFLEIYWVSIHFDANDTYQSQHSAIELALAGRKNMKNFGQAQEPEGSLKCSLCGEREAVHPDGKKAIREVKGFWADVSKHSYVFNEGEYLCYICLAKRYVPQYFKEKNAITDARFPSTAEVAAASYKRHLMDVTSYRNPFFEFENAAAKKVKKQGYHLPKNIDNGAETLDGHWFFEDNYTLEEFQRQDQGLQSQDIQTLLAGLKTLQRSTGNLVPSKYFAVVVMDGDHMGRKIEAVQSVAEHKEMSTTLGKFAREEAREIVEEKYLGKLIYAGGDDLLALANLDHLFSIMEELRKSFSKAFNGNFQRQETFTVSCGVCISHYKSPFSVSLEEARKMAKLAKSATDLLIRPRAAYAIEAMTHSGNIRRAVSKWEAGDARHSTIAILKELEFLLRPKIVSDKFIYTMKREFAPVCDTDGAIRERSIVAHELGRLLWRASDKEKLKALLSSQQCITSDPRECIDDLREGLMCIFEGMNFNLENFLSLLDITNVISREALL